MLIYVKCPLWEERTFSRKILVVLLSVNVTIFLFSSKDMGILSSDNLDQLRLKTCHVKRAALQIAAIWSVSLKIKGCAQKYFQASLIEFLMWSCFLIKCPYKTTYLQFCFEVWALYCCQIPLCCSDTDWIMLLRWTIS